MAARKYKQTGSRFGPRNRSRNSKKVLICTEGTLTEPAYLERWAKHMGIHVTVERSKKSDPRGVVDECIRLRDEAKNKGSKYNECFCLVDVDEHEL